MRIISDLSYRPYCNIRGKERIELRLQLFRVKGTVDIGMEELLLTMNPGVGTPAANDPDRAPEDGRERLLQNRLYTECIGLTLPTRITLTKIAGFEKITHGKR